MFGGRLKNMLIDKDSYYLNTEAKTVTVLDEGGEVVGYFYCPYIPKVFVESLERIRKTSKEERR